MTSRPKSEGADADITSGSLVVRLLDLEPASPLPDAERDAFRRRYSVLFAENGTSRRGGLGMVWRVSNAYGERLALKTLLDAGADDLVATQSLAPGARDSAAIDGRRRDALLAAFKAEYEGQRALQGLGCVPKLYGWGVVDGLPAILMEWVDGETLEHAAKALAVDDAGRVSPPVAAAIGRDLFNALATLASASDPVVHRDISPANVMVRTSGRSLEQQVADGAFDLCLIDFGSSVVGMPSMGSLTRAGLAVRWATPDYAPPEMLTNDAPGVAELRRSPLIDVYAAASTIYKLACGVPPFGSDGARGMAGLSPYRIKVDLAPADPVLAHANAQALDATLLREPRVADAVATAISDLPEVPTHEECSRDLGLVDARISEVLLGCLASDQAARPSASDVACRLGVIAARYCENVGHALRGEPLGPREEALVGVAPLRARRVLRLVGYAACVAVTVAACAGLAAQLESTRAVALALPLVAGLVLRARGRSTLAGMIRGAVGVLLGATTAWAILARALPEGLAPVSLVPVLLCVCSGAWLPMAIDYATLSEGGAQPAAANAAQPADNAGEGA
ncbi:protein kinase domain-containing protein [Parolsenella catena]|uniref:protein kinase domain-containing protein n=1 Tax=Parolsenella catena TaxID=2003188 RepID=UPI003AF0EDC1